MAITTLLPTFARGEVSPLLYGRTDIDQYPTCLAECTNCIVRPYGVVGKVSGTHYVADGVGPARLLKFVFNANESYMIECSAGAFRFFYDGMPVLNSDQTVYQIANPFTQEQLPTIQYIQLDDVIKIVYADDEGNTNEPLELIRYAENHWELRKTPFVSTPYLPENITATTMTANGTTGTIVVTCSTDYFNQNHVGAFLQIGDETTVHDVKKYGYVKIRSVSDARTVIADVQWQLSTTAPTTNFAEGAWSKARGYPSTIGIFESRLYYGRTPTNPRNIFGSRPFQYEDFLPGVDNEDDGAINVELATNAGGDGSDIKWIVGGNYLLVGTFGSEFIIKGGENGITPTTVSANAKTNWGSENIQPLTLGALVHFVQRTGKKIRQFTYDYYLDTYKAVDISLFSEHLLSSPIKALAYQKMPDSILWAVRTDGIVIGLTQETEQLVQAWFKLNLNGVVESVETIPSIHGDFDEVYFIVKRVINGVTVRHIERMINPVTSETLENCFYVQSGIEFDAFSQTTGITLSVSDRILMTNTPVFSADDHSVQIGTTSYQITQYISSTMVEVETAPTQSVVSGGQWAIGVRTIPCHLEQEKVQGIADGVVFTDKIVDQGKITFDTDVFHVVVGLGYDAVVTTMPIDYGTSVGEVKKVVNLAVRVWRTNSFKIGNGTEFFDVPCSDLYTGIIDRIKFNQGWTTQAQVTFKQELPVPMNVLAVKIN